MHRLFTMFVCYEHLSLSHSGDGLDFGLSYEEQARSFQSKLNLADKQMLRIRVNKHPTALQNG